MEDKLEDEQWCWGCGEREGECQCAEFGLNPELVSKEEYDARWSLGEEYDACRKEGG